MTSYTRTTTCTPRPPRSPATRRTLPICFSDIRRSSFRGYFEERQKAGRILRPTIFLRFFTQKRENLVTQLFPAPQSSSSAPSHSRVLKVSSQVKSSQIKERGKQSIHFNVSTDHHRLQADRVVKHSSRRLCDREELG